MARLGDLPIAMAALDLTVQFELLVVEFARHDECINVAEGRVNQMQMAVTQIGC